MTRLSSPASQSTRRMIAIAIAIAIAITQPTNQPPLM